MPVNIGVNIQRSPNRINQQLREAGVEGKFPKLLLDFKDQYYLASGGSKTLANAVTHARSGNAVMTDGYGPELVTNGGFTSDSDWTKGTGWSIRNGLAYCDGSQTGSSLLEQSWDAEIGDVYVFSFRVVSRDAGGVSAAVQGATPEAPYVTATGYYEQVVRITDSTTAFSIRASSSFIGSIDNVSVREMPVLKWAPHNLFTYSEEFDNAAWSTLGINLTSVTTDLPTGASGTAYRVQDTDQGLLWQSLSLPVGSKHTVAVWAKRGGSVDNIFGLHIDGNLVSSQFTATSEWQLFEFETTVATGGSRSAGLIDFTGQVYDIIIWGMYLYRSDLGGMVDNPDQPPSRASYVPTTSAAKYLPRIGHHVYNGSAWVNEGLLAESEARTNLVVQSHDFNTSWSKVNASVTSDDAVGPDGLESADLLVANTTNSQHRLDLIPTSSAGTQTFSVYLKPNGYSDAWLRIGTSGSGFNLTDGSTFITTGGITTTAQEVGNGWYRCSVTTTNASANDTVRINVLGSSSANDFAGDGTSGIYIYGAQLEAASTPSSLIPTSGSTVTRAAETFTIPSANLPWPNPNYIGSELVTNGTFDTDSDWIKGTGWTISGGKANLDTSVAGAGVFTQIYQNVTTTAGKVYAVSADFDTLTNVTDSEIFFRVEVGAILSKSQTTTGTKTYYFVAQDSSTTISVDAGSGHDGNETVVVDNISVREIDPLSVSIAMDGRVTYADTDSSLESLFVSWYEDADNRIRLYSQTSSASTGRIVFEQEASNVNDYVITSQTLYSPDILVPFSISSRHGSTFVNGATDGVALTANTTPTALPDLSSTNLLLGSDYMGTIGTFRVWDRDIADTGLVEATNPSLEPSLSLTFEGTGTNSFVVNDWSE